VAGLQAGAAAVAAVTTLADCAAVGPCAQECAASDLGVWRSTCAAGLGDQRPACAAGLRDFARSIDALLAASSSSRGEVTASLWDLERGTRATSEIASKIVLSEAIPGDPPISQQVAALGRLTADLCGGPKLGLVGLGVRPIRSASPPRARRRSSGGMETIEVRRDRLPMHELRLLEILSERVRAMPRCSLARGTKESLPAHGSNDLDDSNDA